MQQGEEQIGTEIVDEGGSTAKKTGKRIWLYVGLGIAGLAILVTVLIMRVPHHEDKPAATAADLEQQKYDAGQKEQERQKAARIRDDTFIVRKGDDAQAQLNSLLKDLNLEKGQPSELPTPADDSKARAEEEAIDYVLRNPAPKQPPAVRTSSPQPKSAPASPVPAGGDAGPMFVYSRTFGGAKYLDAPQKQAVARSEAPPADSSPARSTTPQAPKPDQPAPHAADEKTTVIYTDYPPVTLYEGEMLEAVLVNRIIADIEPSPVVCSISKDLFDRSARYVVFPANSRVVGLSQVVNYKGAHRLFINFQRIILPNGPSIDLPPSRKAMRALDETGALGVVSNVERHWFLQFGTAIFFGALDGLAGAAQRNRDAFSTTSVILGRTSENFQRILENIMSQYSTIVPTIRVDQGKKMLIYLSDDILISPYAKISDRSYYAKR
jgi:type IV secretory pathway VirB10-like protein